MNNANDAKKSSPAPTVPQHRINIRTLTLIGLFTAISCVLGVWAIPIGPISITLGLFSIFLNAYILGWKKGTISILIYLLLGAMGLPVFSCFSGGLGIILGPGGGYIVSWILVGLIVGFFSEKFPLNTSTHIALKFLGFLLGIAVCYLVGTIWFVQVAYDTHTVANYVSALAVCVYPFIPLDIAKAVATLLMGPKIRKALLQTNLLEIYTFTVFLYIYNVNTYLLEAQQWN